MRRAPLGAWAVIALILAGLYPVDNPDSFGHLAAGRQIAELGGVPTYDTFSYFRPAPQPWVNYEWLSDLGMFAVVRLSGFVGLNLFKLAIVAALGIALIRLATARAGELGGQLCAVLLVAAVPALRFRLSARPHVAGLALSALYWVGLLRILDAASSDEPARRIETRRWVIGLGCAHVLWVNLHGSHLLGVALTAAACVAGFRSPRARRPLASLLGLQLIASCISPYGPSIVLGSIAHVFDPRYREIVGEWQAWSAAQPLWYAIGPALHALAFALAWRGLPRDAAGHFMKLGGLLLLLMAARSMRFISDFLLLASPLIAEGLTRSWQQLRQGPPMRSERASWIAWGAVALAVSAGAFALSVRLPPYAAFGLGADLRTLPAATGRWLEQHRPRARVWAAMEDGWYLMYGAPQAKMLLDGRVPFYGPEHMLAMIKGWSSPHSLRRTIATTNTDTVVVQPILAEHQAALATMLQAPDFRLVMIENKHALFVRGAATGFSALVPGYAAAWLLSSTANLPAIRAELARLRREPNAGVYVAWVDALSLLRPLARADGKAGFAPPTAAGDRRAVLRALELLRPLQQVLEDVPSVSAYHALASVLACRLDEAEAVLASIRDEDRSRESTFAEQELRLRRDERDAVRSFVAAARNLPDAQGDPWLAALEQGLAAPPSCALAAAAALR